MNFIINKSSMFNSFWKEKIKFNWIFGLFLILMLGIPRFIIVMKANVTGKFNYVSIIFLVMWILPYMFLSKKGRKFIGVKKIKDKKWIVYSFLTGAGASLIIYLIGVIFYKYSFNNWFVYLAKPFAMYNGLTGSNKLIVFIISAIIAMTFSPIGEELLYRGIVHGSFQVDIGDNKASYVDSSAFALVHLWHFGIIYENSQWNFLFIPSLLWIIFMFFTSRLFYVCKKKSGSILGAIISHAAFNLVMMYIIFYNVL